MAARRRQHGGTTSYGHRFRVRGGRGGGSQVGGLTERGERRSGERLDEKLTVPAAHRRDDRSVTGSRGSEEREAWYAFEFNAPADCQAMRCGDGYTQAGEAARSDADKYFGRDAASQQLADHRDKPFGMPAADDLVARVE